jgi:hypothetical protein
MDEWRSGLVSRLLGEQHPAAKTSFDPSAGAQLEIAFGRARSELTYLLELGRANGLPFTGSLVGDEIWVRLGDRTTLTFRIERASASILANVPGRGDVLVRWDGAKSSLVEANGDPVDIPAFVRTAIDAAVAQFKSPAT